MLTGIAIVLATLFLWELVVGLGLVGWGLIELIRQLLFGSR